MAKDLLETKGALKEMVQDGVVFLGVCGGYQLSGRFYRGLDGVEIPGAACSTCSRCTRERARNA